MKYCGLCPKAWPDDTVMRMGRGSNLCPDCVQTSRGQQELESDLTRRQRLFGGRDSGRTKEQRMRDTMAYHLAGKWKGGPA